MEARTCGGILNAFNGTLKYPASNTTYTHNSRCAWLIKTDEEKVLNITFTMFSVERSNDCRFDWLQVFYDVLYTHVCIMSNHNRYKIVTNFMYADDRFMMVDRPAHIWLDGESYIWHKAFTRDSVRLFDLITLHFADSVAMSYQTMAIS